MIPCWLCCVRVVVSCGQSHPSPWLLPALITVTMLLFVLRIATQTKNENGDLVWMELRRHGVDLPVCVRVDDRWARVSLFYFAMGCLTLGQRRNLNRAAYGDVREAATFQLKHCLLPGECLPAPDRHIDIDRV